MDPSSSQAPAQTGLTARLTGIHVIAVSIPPESLGHTSTPRKRLKSQNHKAVKSHVHNRVIMLILTLFT